MATLFCQSPKCDGHEMSQADILADIDRWPRARMVAGPLTPRRRPRQFARVASADKVEAVRRVDAGESVMQVAAAVGVSKMTIYNWRSRRTDLETL